MPREHEQRNDREASKTAAGPKVVQVPAPNRTVVEVPGRTQKLVPVVREQSTQVPSLDMHHDACSPTGCHPECRIKLPSTGVQSQIHL